MPATLDLPAVRDFMRELNDQLMQCEKEPNRFCSTLDAKIKLYSDTWDKMWEYIQSWASMIFRGQSEFDQQAEDLLKAQAARWLQRAEGVAARSKPWEDECFELAGLSELCRRIVWARYLLSNWVTPQPAASPSPRVQLKAEAKREMMSRLAALPPLADDWQPADPGLKAIWTAEHEKAN